MRSHTVLAGLAGLAGLATTLVVLVTAGVTSSPAVAAPPTPDRVAQVAAAEVRDGSLLRDHGTRSVCPTCQGLVVTTAPGSTTALRTTTPAGYGPYDLAAAYWLPAGGSTGTIAILDAGVDPRLETDLAHYRSSFGLPACTTASGCLQLIDYTGAAQPRRQTSGPGVSVEEQVAEETSLDVDMASAACPGCRLLEISLPWQDAVTDNDVSTGDFTTAVGTAVRAGADAVSISYGYTADTVNTSTSVQQTFAARGTVVTASTGDDGFNGPAHQLWPADLPGAVAVGGTTQPQDGPLTAWDRAGSGCESLLGPATGQPTAIAAHCSGHRSSADISADTDPATGVAVYDTYAPASGMPDNWVVAGGTSASAPYVAALYVRAGAVARVHGPDTVYGAAGTAFQDVRSGDNNGADRCLDAYDVDATVCQAGPGWDGPTGRGIPNGLTAFRPAPSTS